jgi:hypothetical protein
MFQNQNESDYNEKTDLGVSRPHVVILGAGASKASFPNGDKNGFTVPLMDELISVCGLQPVFEKSNISLDTIDFEEIYSKFHSSSNSEMLELIESRVSQYFSSLELKESPTIYDMLVISLRRKDLIATFNWDPFLWQALERNQKWIEVPDAAFLHGSVVVGYCAKDYRKGSINANCPICNQPFKGAPLMYPVEHKNYQNHQFISAEWSKLRRYLKSAYMITIFGYGAPTSDVEAIDLMKNAYNAPGIRNMEQIEIIDTKPEDELRHTWSSFIVEHHYQIFNNFYDSWIANHPRRTCDTIWQQLEELRFLDPHNFPITDNWNVIREWYQPLIDAEINDKHR